MIVIQFYLHLLASGGHCTATLSSSIAMTDNEEEYEVGGSLCVSLAWRRILQSFRVSFASTSCEEICTEQTIDLGTPIRRLKLPSVDRTFAIAISRQGSCNHLHLLEYIFKVLFSGKGTAARRARTRRVSITNVHTLTRVLDGNQKNHSRAPKTFLSNSGHERIRMGVTSKI